MTDIVKDNRNNLDLQIRHTIGIIVNEIPTIGEYELQLEFNGQLNQDMPYHINNFGNGIHVAIYFDKFKLGRLLKINRDGINFFLSRPEPNLILRHSAYRYGKLVISGNDKTLGEFIDDVNKKFNMDLLMNKL